MNLYYLIHRSVAPLMPSTNWRMIPKDNSLYLSLHVDKKRKIRANKQGKYKKVIFKWCGIVTFTLILRQQKTFSNLCKFIRSLVEKNCFILHFSYPSRRLRRNVRQMWGT